MVNFMFKASFRRIKRKKSTRNLKEMKYWLVVVPLLFQGIAAFYLSENQKANFGRSRSSDTRNLYNNNQFRNARYQMPSLTKVSMDDEKSELENSRRKEIQRYMTGAEHAHLRNTLKTAILILDSENGYLGDSESENSFYVQHLLSLINKDNHKEEKRNHRRRNTFDSIAHQGGLSGFRGYGPAVTKQRKRPFTFQELLPYLLNEMRRNSREIPPRS